MPSLRGLVLVHVVSSLGGRRLLLIDWCGWSFAAEHCPGVVSGEHRQAGSGLDGGGAEVRHEHNVLEPEQSGVHAGLVLKTSSPARSLARTRLAVQPFAPPNLPVRLSSRLIPEESQDLPLEFVRLGVL